jgi:predicted DNA-binding transcriptional regulator AlpA
MMPGPYLRFRDLKARGVVNSWTQLYRMIDREGFPPGILLSPGVRVFPEREVERWLAQRVAAGRHVDGDELPNAKRLIDIFEANFMAALNAA